MLSNSKMQDCRLPASPSEKTKTCPSCHETKRERDFSRGRNQCRSCRSAQHDAYRATTHGRATRLLGGARGRAKKKGLSFSLSLEWVAARLDAGACELSDIAFAHKGKFAPSIDRIDSSKGYEASNCRVVATYVNSAIAQFGSKTFERVAIKYLMARRPDIFVIQPRKRHVGTLNQLDMFVDDDVLSELELAAQQGRHQERPRA